MIAGTTLTLLVGFAAIGSIIPPFVLRRRRTIWFAFDAGSWALALALVAVGPRFGFRIGPDLAIITLIWIKLTVFCAVTATGATVDRFRFTPLVAAILAGSIYLVFVPHVLRWAVDGDEPYYVLIAESLVHDHDLDLANQYDGIEQSVTRRVDLSAQLGDPVGPNGEQYSRHEPLLPLLLVPGLLLGGLRGAVATMAIFGALLVWSLMSLLEEEGIPWASAVAAYPFIALGPPVLFYSTRIWPEVPAALCLTEALRASRKSRWVPLVLWLVGLSLLKLRFIPIAVALLAVIVIRSRAGWKLALSALAIIGLPLVVVWFATGRPLSVHHASELEPQAPLHYVRGALGLLLDGQAGMLFQAPFWLFAFVPLLRWKEAPRAVRDLAIASIPYVILLLPRAEWHGGWSPPLRYLVVFAPLFALGGAWAIERVRPFWIALAAIWTAVISIHGMAFPYRLFHIANGENVVGELLSKVFHSDFSRLFPSLIRSNGAVLPWAIAVGLFAVTVAIPAIRNRVRRIPSTLLVAIVTLGLAGGVRAGMQAGNVVQFEDSHVIHEGGSLYPQIWTVARFRYAGGWQLSETDSLVFHWAGGPSVLRYSAPAGAVIRVGDEDLVLKPTGDKWETRRVDLPRRGGRWTLVCVEGAATVDWLRHE